MKDNIPVYDKDGKVSKEYGDYLKEQGRRIKERYCNSIDIHQFEQNGKQCGVRVNFFDPDELMKVIEAGAATLNLKDKVWLTGYLKA